MQDSSAVARMEVAGTCKWKMVELVDPGAIFTVFSSKHRSPIHPYLPNLALLSARLRRYINVHSNILHLNTLFVLIWLWNPFHWSIGSYNDLDRVQKSCSLRSASKQKLQYATKVLHEWISRSEKFLCVFCSTVNIVNLDEVCLHKESWDIWCGLWCERT